MIELLVRALLMMPIDGWPMENVGYPTPEQVFLHKYCKRKTQKLLLHSSLFKSIAELSNDKVSVHCYRR
jgi:hypothetical protein